MARPFLCTVDRSSTSVIRTVTTDTILRSDDPFIQRNQCLCGLDGRTGRILSFDGPVIQGFCGIGQQIREVQFTQGSGQEVWIIGRAAGHCNDASGFGIDGYNGTQLIGQKFFCQHLHINIHISTQISSGDGNCIISTILVRTHEPVLIVLDAVLYPTLAHEDILIRTLQSGESHVITQLIKIIGAPQDIGIHLTDISQHVLGHFKRVRTDRSVLQIKAGFKSIDILLKLYKLLNRQCTFKNGRPVSSILYNRRHQAFPELRCINVKDITQSHCINSFQLGWHNHKIMRHRILQNRFSISVED